MPVLAPPNEQFDSELFGEEIVPDPVSYGDWFADASEANRKAAVGSRLYNVAKDVWGGQPPWEMFVNPDDGKLITAAQIEAEPEHVRDARMLTAITFLAERKAWIAQALRFGALAAQ